MGEVLTTFSRKGDLKEDHFMRFHDIDSSATRGFVPPFSGEITRVSINRSDTDLCTINIVVNGAVQHQIDTAQTALVEVLVTPVSFNQGDVIAIENDATSNKIKDSSVNLYMEDGAPVPGALTIRDMYRIQMMGAVYGGLISAHGSKTVLKDGNTARVTANRIEQIDEIVDELMATRP